MSGHGPIPTAVRLAVDERDRRHCMRCSATGREIHHRMRRREAGHAMSVCILLCRTCHRFVHANPTQAKADGFIVPPWGDTLTMPVKSYRGWITLADDGSYAFTGAPTDPPVEVENR